MFSTQGLISLLASNDARTDCGSKPVSSKGIRSPCLYCSKDRGFARRCIEQDSRKLLTLIPVSVTMGSVEVVSTVGSRAALEDARHV